MPNYSAIALNCAKRALNGDYPAVQTVQSIDPDFTPGAGQDVYALAFKLLAAFLNCKNFPGGAADV
ncbi:MULTISPECIES: hypothetical protein [Leptolyngbya]|uniref:hypothetical protein n=1 Tax=Leptolyngbya TaxID=47251 RepID=UPI001688AFB1|nr:hypothetical protein [Leptolyngbya sp. FACHB-1624]MBD1857433.1 hypothetical protein [Leptolyngbya sp. FACHB-1624]